jgi:hypothetical protein
MKNSTGIVRTCETCRKCSEACRRKNGMTGSLNAGGCAGWKAK